MSTQIESLTAEKTPLHTAAQIREMVDMADYAETLLNRHVTVMEVGRWLDLLGSAEECLKFTQGLAMWQGSELCHWNRGAVSVELDKQRAVVAGSGGRVHWIQ